jgi:hypothetical protein
MAIELTLISHEIKGGAFEDITQDFCNTLVQDAKIDAKLKSSEPKEGAKGEPITLGVIILAFITSGAAVALFNVFSQYFDRSSTLEFSLKKKNGDSISFKSKNVTQEERERTLKKLENFLDD